MSPQHAGPIRACTRQTRRDQGESLAEVAGYVPDSSRLSDLTMARIKLAVLDPLTNPTRATTLHRHDMADPHQNKLAS